EADRLDEVLVQAQRTRDRARDLRNLERVREARPIEIAFVVHEHLRLVDETAECGRVDHAIAVALELGSVRGRVLEMAAAARARRWRRCGGGRGARLGRRAAHPDAAARTDRNTARSGAGTTTARPSRSIRISFMPLRSAFLSSCIRSRTRSASMPLVVVGRPA